MHIFYRRLLLIFVILSISFHSAALYAYQMACCERGWRPVLTLSGGYFATWRFGETQTFPIVNPVVDSFFVYSPNKSAKYVSFFEVFFGYEWVITQDKWSAQLGLAYDQSSTLNASGSWTLTQGADFASQDSFTYRYDVFIKQLFVATKVMNSFWCRYHPYVAAGIGASFNRATSFSTTVPPFLTFTRLYGGKTTNSFSYFVGVGLDFDLDEALRVGLSYRFIDFGKVSLGKANIDGTPVPGTLSQSHLYANALLLQITALLNW